MALVVVDYIFGIFDYIIDYKVLSEYVKCYDISDVSYLYPKVYFFTNNTY